MGQWKMKKRGKKGTKRGEDMKNKSQLNVREIDPSESIPNQPPQTSAESPQVEGPNFSEGGKLSVIPDHKHPKLFFWTENWPLANFLHGKNHQLIKFMRMPNPTGRVRFFFKFERTAETEKIAALWDTPEGYQDIKEYDRGRLYISARVSEWRSAMNGRSK